MIITLVNDNEPDVALPLSDASLSASGRSPDAKSLFAGQTDSEDVRDKFRKCEDEGAIRP
jgi:hypothetical protein